MENLSIAKEKKEKTEEIEQSIQQLESKLGSIRKEVEYIQKNATFTEHIYPAIQWLKQQPEGKKFAIKMSNLPYLAKVENIKSAMKKIYKIQDADTINIHMEVDNKMRSKGIAFLSSDNKDSLEKILRMHGKLWAKRKLKTRIMGFSYYDNQEDYDDEEGDED